MSDLMSDFRWNGAFVGTPLAGESNLAPRRRRRANAVEGPAAGPETELDSEIARRIEAATANALSPNATERQAAHQSGAAWALRELKKFLHPEETA